MDQLYRTHFSMLHALANNILHDDDLAGDAVTDGMMSLFSKVEFLRSLEELELLGYGEAGGTLTAYVHDSIG